MSKNILKKLAGWFLVAGFILWWFHDVFVDTFKDFGWNAIWVTPIIMAATIGVVIGFISLVEWLFGDEE